MLQSFCWQLIYFPLIILINLRGILLKTRLPSIFLHEFKSFLWLFLKSHLAKSYYPFDPSHSLLCIPLHCNLPPMCGHLIVFSWVWISLDWIRADCIGLNRFALNRRAVMRISVIVPCLISHNYLHTRAPQQGGNSLP